MKIAVHGTQGGANTFTSEFLSGVSDPNSDAPSDHSAGHQCFAINFTKNECVFSKYGIIKDVQGNRRVGNIGFSLGIQNESKIAGSDVKEVLNRLAKEFYEEHIDAFDNLDTFREDWTFIEDIKRDYQDKEESISDKSNIEVFTQGERDAAFIYYSSEKELQKYFDVPYQEDYKPYKRVFFIDQKYKGKGKANNPLHALSHSEDADLTNRKILENLPYRVVIPHNNNSIFIKVSSDGKDIQNKGKVRPYDSIKITFTKRNYNELPINGTIVELEKKYPEQVKVDESNRKLTITPPNQLTATTKEISLRIQDWKGKEVKGATIEKRNSRTNKNIENNTVTFEGDELDKEWQVVVNGKVERTFTPNESENKLDIPIQEEETISFEVNTSQYSIKLKKTNSNIKITADSKRIIFIDKAIEDDCDIIVSAEGYRSSNKTINPEKDSSPINIKLEERKRTLATTEKGEYTGESTVEPGNKQVWRVLSGAAIILVVLFFGFFFKDNIFGSSNSGTENGVKTQYEQIVAYSEGTELRLVSITKYIEIASKKTTPDSPDNAKEQKEGGWFKSIFGSSKDTAVATNENWVLLSKNLDTIRLIRKAINTGNVDSLKNLSKTFQYSEKQKKFKTAVLKIDGLYAKKIGDAMKSQADEVSRMNIDSIAVFINNYQQILKIEIEENEDIESLRKKQKRIKNELKLEPKDFLQTANKVRDSILDVIEKQIKKEDEQDNKSQDTDDDEYGEVQNENESEENSPSQDDEETGTPPIDKSSKNNSGAKAKEEAFEKEFWSLFGSKKKDDYYNLIKKYPDISSKNSIRLFYENYLSESKDFDKFKNTPEMNLKKAKKARDLEELNEYLNKQ